MSLLSAEIWSPFCTEEELGKADILKEAGVWWDPNQRFCDQHKNDCQRRQDGKERTAKQQATNHLFPQAQPRECSLQ